MNKVKTNLIEQTLSEIVNQNFKTASLFERYNLDFCCNGNRTLKTACEEKGVDLNMVVSEIGAALAKEPAKNENYNAWSLDFLVSYIVNNHHHYIRTTSSVIIEHGQKVTIAHGKNHPEIIEVNKVFTLLWKELNQHMMKEEQILFPYIDQMAKALTKSLKVENPFFGTVRNPIKMMENEHQSAGEELSEIKSLTNNFSLPEDACSTFRVYYQGLKEFEQDLHKHIHLENNILFPKSIELESHLQNL